MINHILFFLTVLILTIILFKKTFKSSVLQDPLLIDAVEIKRIRKKFRKFRKFVDLGFVIMIPLFIFVLILIMRITQSLYLEYISESAVYMIGISNAIFAIPSLFMAMLAYGYLIDFAGYIVGNYIFHNNNEYKIFREDMGREYNPGKDGFSEHELKWWLSLFIVPLFLIASYLSVNTYTKITNDYLINKEYFSFNEKKYSYNDVSKINYFSHFKNRKTGKIEKQTPHYSVTMKDGYEWRTLNTNINNSPIVSEVINFISEKSGIKLVYELDGIND